jgi:hypothetical protein
LEVPFILNSYLLALLSVALVSRNGEIGSKEVIEVTGRDRFFDWFIPHRSRLRKFAYSHACMLSFLSFMFIVTWVIIVYANYIYS